MVNSKAAHLSSRASCPARGYGCACTRRPTLPSGPNTTRRRVVPCSRKPRCATACYVRSRTASTLSLLDASPNLKCVANLAVGYDNIDVTACTEHGVLVCNTPGVLTETTAELTMALLLSYTRRIVEGDARRARWALDRVAPQLHARARPSRRHAGHRRARRHRYGRGATGARLRHAGRLHVARSRKPDAERELGIEYLSLDDLLGRATSSALPSRLTTTRGSSSARGSYR